MTLDCQNSRNVVKTFFMPIKLSLSTDITLTRYTFTNASYFIQRNMLFNNWLIKIVFKVFISGLFFLVIRHKITFTMINLKYVHFIYIINIIMDIWATSNLDLLYLFYIFIRYFL